MNQKKKDVRVIRIGREELPLLLDLWREVEAESQPGNPRAADEAESGLKKSLASFDFLSSESFWILAGQVDGKLVGYAAVTRIPKADARVGVLYVDELYVLRAYRRRGVAESLVRELVTIGTEVSAWRVRLLVDPENEAARKLYAKVGFTEGNELFCEMSL